MPKASDDSCAPSPHFGLRVSPCRNARLQDVGRCIRQQCHVACPLQRDCQHALVARARSSFAARINLSPIGKVAPKKIDVFVVDMINMVDCEVANLASRNITTAPSSAPSTTTPRGTAWGPSEGRSPFRTRSAWVRSLLKGVSLRSS